MGELRHTTGVEKDEGPDPKRWILRRVRVVVKIVSLEVPAAI